MRSVEDARAPALALALVLASASADAAAQQYLVRVASGEPERAFTITPQDGQYLLRIEGGGQTVVPADQVVHVSSTFWSGVAGGVLWTFHPGLPGTDFGIGGEVILFLDLRPELTLPVSVRIEGVFDPQSDTGVGTLGLGLRALLGIDLGDLLVWHVGAQGGMRYRASDYSSDCSCADESFGDVGVYTDVLASFVTTAARPVLGRFEVGLTGAVHFVDFSPTMFIAGQLGARFGFGIQ
jgi:hypothetical protein